MASKVPPTQFSHKDFLVGHYANCFFLNPTTTSEVSSIVHSLKNSKCEGLDGLSMSPIKETIDLLDAPLSHICNLSLKHGVFPDKLGPSQTIDLFLFSPVSLRYLRISFTSGYRNSSQSSISLIITSTVLDLITLLLWLS